MPMRGLQKQKGGLHASREKIVPVYRFVMYKYYVKPCFINLSIYRHSRLKRRELAKYANNFMVLVPHSMGLLPLAR